MVKKSNTDNGHMVVMSAEDKDSLSLTLSPPPHTTNSVAISTVLFHNTSLHKRL